jgi:hypothetical protein
MRCLARGYASQISPDGCLNVFENRWNVMENKKALAMLLKTRMNQQKPNKGHTRLHHLCRRQNQGWLRCLAVQSVPNVLMEREGVGAIRWEENATSLAVIHGLRCQV